MNQNLLHTISALNSNFYRTISDSFSATRQSPWNGWKTLAELFREQENTNQSLSVLDLACGNLRFEEFLTKALAPETIHFTCIDNCTALLPGELNGSISFKEIDIVQALNQESLFLEENCYFDICVSFGFMHHLPTERMRKILLETLISHTKTNGLIAVSFWQFANHQALAKKAALTTQKAKSLLKDCVDLSDLNENDYFLGWRDTENIYRYCHHFTEDELTHLVELVSKKAELIHRFHADGRNDQLNSYLVFRKK